MALDGIGLQGHFMPILGVGWSDLRTSEKSGETHKKPNFRGFIHDILGWWFILEFATSDWILQLPLSVLFLFFRIVPSKKQGYNKTNKENP